MLATFNKLQGQSSRRVSRKGTVEDHDVPDIILDTETCRTRSGRAWCHLRRWFKGEVHIRCAHGNSVSYPLAKLNIGVGGKTYTLETAVAENLPFSVLLFGASRERAKLSRSQKCANNY